MKVAFLVLHHRHPAQLVRLLTTLRSQLPDSPIVVHHDVFHGEFPSEIIEPIGNVHLLMSRRPAAWGDYSLADICRWSLTWMVEHIDFDWVVLLSAQDYPLKPLSGLACDLTGNNADALLHATPIAQLTNRAARRDMRRRYLYQYRPAPVGKQSPPVLGNVRHAFRRSTGRLVDVINILQPFFKIYRLPDQMPYRFGRRVRNTPFGRDNPCCYGAMWFSLSRRAAKFVLDYMSDHPEYVDHYRKTIVPDESIIATLIFNSPYLRVESRDSHYTRWTHAKTGHPDTFGLDDLPELLAAPQYFARKFDINSDPHILDKLDEYIGGVAASNL